MAGYHLAMPVSEELIIYGWIHKSGVVWGIWKGPNLSV